MSDGRWWRWGGLALIGVVAAVFASFNAGERVALNFGFAIFYRVPLVSLIFLAFLAGMTTMFLLGLRHDLRVRRALREAGFGEPIAVEEEAPLWGDEEEAEATRPLPAEGAPDPAAGSTSFEARWPEEPPPGSLPDSEPPPRYPP